jgi:hypothetical protein
MAEKLTSAAPVGYKRACDEQEEWRRFGAQREEDQNEEGSPHQGMHRALHDVKIILCNCPWAALQSHNIHITTRSSTIQDVSTIKRILFISAPGQSEASSHPASDRCNKELKTRPGTLVRLHLRDDLPWLAVAD